MSGSDGGTFRIAFVGHKTMPANYGGVEVSAEEIGARLAARGHTVISFTSGLAAERLTHRGIDCHRVGRVDGKHVGALSQAFTATVAAIRARPDIVHFQAMGPSVFAPLVRLLTRAEVIVTVAGRDDQRRKWGRLARQLMRLSYVSATRSTHGVIGVSKHLADELTPAVKGTCVYIPNGVMVPDAPSDDLTALGIDDRPFVLYAGRLVPEKRIETLIAAFRTLADDVDLIIAGGPAGAKGYEELLHRTAGDDGRIRFVGHQAAGTIDALMRRTSAFVLVSELEGLPIALLEATGRGAPVVLSDLPCHREVVGTAGPGARLVPVDDVHAIARAIADTLADPDASTDARRRRDRVLATYDWDAVAESTESFYRQLRDR